MTDAFLAFAAAHTPGIAIVDACARHASKLGIDKLSADTGIPPLEIRAHLEAHKQLSPHRELAATLGIPLDTLLLVSTWSKRVLPDDIPVLLRAVENTTYTEAEDHLRAATRELNRGKNRTRPRGSVAVAKRPDYWGRRRVSFYLTDAEHADMKANAGAYIAAAREKDPTLSYGQALHMWLLRQLTTPVSEARKTYKPVLLMPVDSSLTWERGYLVTADGVRVDPVELLKAQLDDTGWALQTALDATGTAQAITVARIQNTRFSTGEHRMIAALDTLVCSWPGCHHIAMDCQAHHIHPAAQGGETSWENLAPLCKKHNGMNDDLRTVRNGRIIRGNGGYPGHQRRPGDPVRYSANDLLTAGWRGLTYDAYARAST
ncbi:HNH endonuclease [Corynebacterium epidermidicanis]|uniref:HNH endonuclease n=1 Tax=Corynebacterium epidermidicanis TaxID=1050174 RepID=A0A0G3GR05_9CORY|nr:HNH endonuclease signature motif containing protein [Corynebacterium epidermidicanis]AKK03010.1 HNH endonuclease [Corynebacterium epidermidicanis]